MGAGQIAFQRFKKKKIKKASLDCTRVNIKSSGTTIFLSLLHFVQKCNFNNLVCTCYIAKTFLRVLLFANFSLSS